MFFTGLRKLYDYFSFRNTKKSSLREQLKKTLEFYLKDYFCKSFERGKQFNLQNINFSDTGFRIVLGVNEQSDDSENPYKNNDRICYGRLGQKIGKIYKSLGEGIKENIQTLEHSLKGLLLDGNNLEYSNRRAFSYG